MGNRSLQEQYPRLNFFFAKARLEKMLNRASILARKHIMLSHLHHKNAEAFFDVEMARIELACKKLF